MWSKLNKYFRISTPLIEPLRSPFLSLNQIWYNRLEKGWISSFFTHNFATRVDNIVIIFLSSYLKQIKFYGTWRSKLRGVKVMGQDSEIWRARTKYCFFVSDWDVLVCVCMFAFRSARTGIVLENSRGEKAGNATQNKRKEEVV